MARYVDIECDAVREVLPRRAFKTRQDIQDFLDDIPTVDAVPVVRCKDCKYAYINSYSAASGNALCSASANVTQQDDFCSYGERKDGGVE